MSRGIGVLALIALGCAACAGESPQVPAGPSGAGIASAPQGATIVGNVTAGVPLAAMAAQVVGTSISSPVGTGGEFALDGVPAGPVQLRFAGSGVDASVGLSPVQSGDVVSLLVGVAGATATIQAESRNAGGKIEIEGRVESLPPAQPALTLIVAGRTVTTDVNTAFRDGSNASRTFADLAIGQRVHVKGTLVTGPPAVIAADTITIQNTNTSLPVNVNGVVESLTGTAAAFQFVIGSRTIHGDDKTVFYGDAAGLLSFAALQIGSRVEVKGEQGDAFVYAVRIHINGAATPEPPQDDSASVEGTLILIAPPIPVPPASITTPPTLTIRSTIGGTPVDTIVTTTFSTEVRRRGDVQTLAALAIGQTVHAVGTRLTAGSIVAKMLQIKDDGPLGAFVIEGSLGGLKGTCPAFTFGVNGYSIATSAATTYVPAPVSGCGDLKNGMKVEVEGTRQTDGSVLATKVTKK